jgi:hypothetical protein
LGLLETFSEADLDHMAIDGEIVDDVRGICNHGFRFRAGGGLRAADACVMGLFRAFGVDDVGCGCRLVALALVVGLAGCAVPEKPVFEAFDFDYLTKIKLDVGAIEVDDGWVPRGDARHVEYLAPTRPAKAMRMMAEQRLVPGERRGTAVVRVDDDASIISVAGGSRAVSRCIWRCWTGRGSRSAW